MRDIYYTYACRICEKQDITTPVVKTPKEPSAIPGSFFAAEAVAYPATQKFVMGSPLYRQAAEWDSKGVKLSRQTMSNWLLRCSKNQWTLLNHFLLDGRLEISNNRAERSIKPFVMSRKNFLFANTLLGAQGSAVLFRLIETAKENGPDPYRYLVWVLDTAPKLSQSDASWTEKLLPSPATADCKNP